MRVCDAPYRWRWHNYHGGCGGTNTLNYVKCTVWRRLPPRGRVVFPRRSSEILHHSSIQRLNCCSSLGNHNTSLKSSQVSYVVVIALVTRLHVLVTDYIIPRQNVTRMGCFITSEFQQNRNNNPLIATTRVFIILFIFVYYNKVFHIGTLLQVSRV